MWVSSSTTLLALKRFFLILGLNCGGRNSGRRVGLHDVKASIVMLRTPDGVANIELTQFYRPTGEKDIQRPLTNTAGIRHIAFVVKDIEAVVAKLKKQGAEIIGRIHNYEDTISCATFAGQKVLF